MASKCYFGTYRGVVTSVADPAKKGRVQLKVPQALGSATSQWAEPISYLDSRPKLGSPVWVIFEGGDLRYPVYSSPQTAPMTPPTLTPISGGLATEPAFTGTIGTWIEFTSAQWAPMLIPLPPTRTVRIDIGFNGVNSNSAGATLWLGYKLKWSDDTIIKTPQSVDSARITSGIQTTAFAGAFHNPPLGGPGGPLKVVPCWQVNSNTDTTKIGITYARIWIYPLP